MEALLQTSLEAALKAGQRIMEIYHGRDFQTQSKADDSPITIADKEANTIINVFLQPTGIPIISEENAQKDYNHRQNWSRCWIVDPLDGTKEFIKKNGEFTVNIALVENGRPVLGVIYAPAQDLLYYGNTQKKEAFKAPTGPGQSLEQILKAAEAIAPSTDTSGYKVVGSRSHMNQETLDFIEKLEQDRQLPVSLVSVGSSLKFCLMAEGKAHFYPRFAPTMEWDTAAGQAICEAVGLQVLSRSDNKPMRYNRENLLNEHFLVANEGDFI